MAPSRFPLVAVAALAAVLLAVLMVAQRAPESEGSLLGEPVLPGLSGRLNEVTGLRIGGAGGVTLVSLARSGDAWTVAERDGYPAAVDKVRLALLNLAESKVLEPKTANPERYAQLGVEAVDQAGAAGALVEIESPGHVDRLIVGNYAGQQGEGTYVRRPDEAGSLMAAGNLVPERNPSAWLRRELLDIPSSEVREVVLTASDGAALRVYRDGRGQENFAVADVPRGRTVQSEFVANGLASTLSGLVLEDVARDDGQAGPPSHRARYALFDGRVVDLQGWHGGTDASGNAQPSWLTVQVEVDEAAAREAILAQLRDEAEAAAAADADGAADAAEGDDGADGAGEGEVESEVEGGADPAAPAAGAAPDEAGVAARLAQLQADATALSGRLAGWRYQVPAFKFANIDKDMEDMLQPRD